jgi:hypothetical protein
VLRLATLKVGPPDRPIDGENEVISAAEVNAAVTVLSDALVHNCAEWSALAPPVSERDRWRSQRLKAAFQSMNALLVYTAAFLDRLRLFARDELAPTRLGNYAAALRSYCERCYAFDFDFFGRACS